MLLLCGDVPSPCKRDIFRVSVFPVSGCIWMIAGFLFLRILCQIFVWIMQMQLLTTVGWRCINGVYELQKVWLVFSLLFCGVRSL